MRENKPAVKPLSPIPSSLMMGDAEKVTCCKNTTSHKIIQFITYLDIAVSVKLNILERGPPHPAYFNSMGDRNMRKILLASTAIVALGSAHALAADVTISGSAEAVYTSTDSTSDEDALSYTNDVDISFSTTTDTGISMSMAYGMDEAAAGVDSSLTISADFGTAKFTDTNDDAVEGLDIDVASATPEEGTTTAAAAGTYRGGFSGTGGTSVSYTLPTMVDGLTVAAAMADAGSNVKSSALGLKYSTESNGATITVAAATSTNDNGTIDTDRDHYGISVSMNGFTLMAESNSMKIQEDTADYSSSGVGATYTTGSLTLGAFSRSAETGTSTDDYNMTAYSATYTLAPGLSVDITNTSTDTDSTTNEKRTVVSLDASF